MMRKLVLVFLVAFTTAAFAENYVMVNENFIEVTADAGGRSLLFCFNVITLGATKAQKYCRREKNLRYFFP